jgi:hypothetical protein
MTQPVLCPRRGKPAAKVYVTAVALIVACSCVPKGEAHVMPPGSLVVETPGPKGDA